jgi:hypothetical protein
VGWKRERVKLTAVIHVRCHDAKTLSLRLQSFGNVVPMVVAKVFTSGNEDP